MQAKKLWYFWRGKYKAAISAQWMYTCALLVDLFQFPSVNLNSCLQLRVKTEDENLAEWLVDVTSEAERQGSDKFVTGYEQWDSLHILFYILPPEICVTLAWSANETCV